VYAVTARFLEALRHSHNVRVQVDAYRAGVLIQADLPVAAGAVTIDGSSEVRRQLDLSVADPGLAPAAGDTTGPLTPYGTELFVRRGITFPDGSTEWVPQGWFRVQSVSGSLAPEVLKVQGVDRSRTVADARFLTPTQSVTTNTIPNEIKRLVQGAIPGATFIDRTGSTASTPELVWEQDRWAAINDLATAIGAECFFDADGACVLRPVPSIDSPVSWYVDAGESGVLIGGSKQTSRDTTYNGVVASGERTDNTSPYTATVTDNNPSSPTYWLGPYGQVPYFYSSPIITSLAGAQSAATGLLARTKGLTRSVSLSAVPNPALEPGDVIQVVFPDRTYERHVVDSLTIPLDPGEAMPIGTRSTDPTKE
jgi:hypothetical protein